VKHTQQIPLDLSPAKAMSFERFLTSGCNEKVVAHLKDIESWPAPILLLIGASGTGKSHLATAFTAHFTRALALDDIEAMTESALFK